MRINDVIRDLLVGYIFADISVEIDIIPEVSVMRAISLEVEASLWGVASQKLLLGVISPMLIISTKTILPV
jgi:hypothetical protein